MGEREREGKVGMESFRVEERENMIKVEEISCWTGRQTNKQTKHKGRSNTYRGKDGKLNRRKSKKLKAEKERGRVELGKKVKHSRLVGVEMRCGRF